ncbi:MAG: hypothetical protein LUO93_04280 [Methanomicrobiales archaeon]|nr:hypothetical protein [Methanomicrobiales archaeon]
MIDEESTVVGEMRVIKRLLILQLLEDAIEPARIAAAIDRPVVAIKEFWDKVQDTE